MTGLWVRKAPQLSLRYKCINPLALLAVVAEVIAEYAGMKRHIDAIRWSKLPLADQIVEGMASTLDSGEGKHGCQSANHHVSLTTPTANLCSFTV